MVCPDLAHVNAFKRLEIELVFVTFEAPRITLSEISFLPFLVLALVPGLDESLKKKGLQVR